MGAGWIIAWRLATRNLGLLSTLILVRLLQPSDFGLVALAGGFINSVDALSAIGVQDALVRAPALDRDMYDTGFCLGVLRGILTALVIGAIAWPVGAFFTDPRLTVVMLALSVGTVITAFENIRVVDFRRNLAFRKEFDMQLWSRVVGVVATVAIAAIWETYWALVAGILANRIARLLQSYLMSPYRPGFTLRAWQGIIGFSLWSWAQTVLYQARDRSDSIVVGRLLGAAQVGVFSVGAELGSLPITEIVEPLNRALFSGFASLHNAAESLDNMFLNAVGMGFMLILPAGIGISMVADPIVRLMLGMHWIATVPVVQIMAVAATGAMFSHASGTLLNAIGRPSVTFYVVTVSTIIRVICLLMLVPGFGLPGAAAALSVAAIADVMLFLGIALPRARISPWRLARCVMRPVIATMAMTLLLWQLDMAWTPGHGLNEFGLAIDLVRRAAIGATCYAAALLAIWFATGQPDGAERFTLGVMAKAWKRLRRWELVGVRW
ncbi:oligosaccharide flippase family protein [Rhodopila sp.]|uniref:oligosaccharide flippase family protein n=1 Tax=Rhodopila sp. TaxID=2480087 RepID=UPI003D1488CC